MSSLPLPKAQSVFFIALVCAVLIRVLLFMQVPASLYWEEVALGYDAYSIAQTLHDHHGNFLPLVVFESFGDWKPSGYFYAAAPFMKIFGLHAWVVRLPSLLAGLAIAVGLSLLAGRMFNSRSIAAVVIAVAPWAIHFSLAAWEAHVALAYLVWMQVLLYPLIEGKKITWRSWLGASILATAAAYTYHAQRFIAPALCMLPWGIFILRQLLQKQLHDNILYLVKSTSVVFVIVVLAIGPLFWGQASHRLEETSIFTDITTIEKSNALRERHGFSLLSRLLYHRYVFFAGDVVGNMLTHFSSQFLFVRGDGNLRHSFGNWGMLYAVDALLIVLGITAAIRRKRWQLLYLLCWIVVAVVPASITRPVPHGLRVLPLYPALFLFSVYGAKQLFSSVAISHRKIFIVICTLVYLSGAGLFLRYYATHYRVASVQDWQYGYKEMISTVQRLQQENPNVQFTISREYGRPAMYYFFFTQAEPIQVQAAAQIVPMDQKEFLAYQQVEFVRSPGEVSSSSQVIASSPEFMRQVASSDTVTILKEVHDLSGNVVWVVYERN